MAQRRPLVIIGGQVQEIPTGDSVYGATGGTGSGDPYNGGTDPIIATYAGEIAITTSANRYYHPTSTTISAVYMSLGTPATSGSVQVDIYKNGVSILTGLLSLGEGAYKTNVFSLNVDLTPNDYLTVAVVSAGSGAKDLNVYLVVRANAIGATILLSQISDWPSTVSATEVAYLNGVTAAIQSQLDAKASAAHDHSGVYSPVSHTHDYSSLYAAANHNHDTVYAPIVNGISTVSGASYTLTANDVNRTLNFTNTGAISLTVPANSTTPITVGASVDFYPSNTGQITVGGAGGVTLRSAAGLKTRVQYSAVTIRKVATDEWLLIGDLTP